MSSQEERFRQYEKMLKKQNRIMEYGTPVSCQRCLCYRPDFKYRRCLYARCPFGKENEIFRKRPLSRDRFSDEKSGKFSGANAGQHSNNTK